MSSLKFHLRFSSSLDDRESRLFVRLIHKRKSRSVSTPIFLYRHEWNEKKQEIVLEEANPNRIDYLIKSQEEIAATRIFFESTIIKLEKEGTYSASDLAQAYIRYKAGSGLISYVEKLSVELCQTGHERTARAYRTTVNRLISFVGDSQLHLEGITPSLLTRFEAAMRKEGKSSNTVSFYMRNIRAIYNKALKEHVFEPETYNPFSNVYTGVCQTRKRSLSREEMARLNHIDSKETDKEIVIPDYYIESLQYALDLFLFSFHARGMSFVDMAYLRKENLENGVITYKRKKTGQLIEMKVTPIMGRIIKKYSSKTEDSPYLLPIIISKDIPDRLQYESALRLQNKRLKLLSKFYGLEKTLSTHMARHSWASIAKSANLPLAVISEGLGHTSEKTTAIYLASFDRSVLDRANEKVAKMINQAV